MSPSEESLKIRNTIFEFEQRIDEMQLEFQKYRQGELERVPNWEKLEKEMMMYSRRKIMDYELSNQLDRVMFKFQNRKKIWLRWVEEFHHTSKK